jgi:hypothetical protein
MAINQQILMDAAARDGYQLIVRSDPVFDQVVMGEVLIPNIPNSYGDVYTPEAIREFAYAYAKAGLNTNIINDIEHDLVDVTGQVYVVESFIARASDPDFIEGSWVIAMHIVDKELFQQVIDGTINGFSYEAGCYLQEVQIENLRSRLITGTTSPDLLDGHTHAYIVTVDALNKPVSGSTSETNGHTHAIARHTVTEYTDGHNHRFNVIDDTNGENDD